MVRDLLNGELILILKTGTLNVCSAQMQGSPKFVIRYIHTSLCACVYNGG